MPQNYRQEWATKYIQSRTNQTRLFSQVCEVVVTLHEEQGHRTENILLYRPPVGLSSQQTWWGKISGYYIKHQSKVFRYVHLVLWMKKEGGKKTTAQQPSPEMYTYVQKKRNQNKISASYIKHQSKFFGCLLSVL